MILGALDIPTTLPSIYLTLAPCPIMLVPLPPTQVAKRPAEQRSSFPTVTVQPGDLDAILGPCRHERDAAERLSSVGVAIGLAWTPVGGEVLVIEATKMAGSGELILTGQLGEVMRESVCGPALL